VKRIMKITELIIIVAMIIWLIGLLFDENNKIFISIAGVLAIVLTLARISNWYKTKYQNKVEN